MELDPASPEITTFSMPSVHYEWLRKPFGLKSTPLTFQGMINNLFAGMLGNSMFAHFDDLIIASKNPRTHLKTLQTVLQSLQEAGLKVKLPKCEFLKAKINLLGHEIHGEGIHTSDDKITAVKNIPKPQSLNNVRSFLRLAGYYRPFIHNLSAKAAPLARFLRKEITFHWGASHEKSFQELNHALTNTPVLVFPDYKDLFIMCTDTSTLGLRAILMQCGERGKKHVIPYVNCTLYSEETLAKHTSNP